MDEPIPLTLCDLGTFHRVLTPRAWEGTVRGYRVRVLDLGKGGLGPMRERYWVEFYPRFYPLLEEGFWSEAADSLKGVQREIRKLVREARHLNFKEAHRG